MPRTRIDGSIRDKYGLPSDTLGKHWNKDTVAFYKAFASDVWDDETFPSEFEIERTDFIAFGIVRGRVKRARTRAERLELTHDLQIMRSGINLAARGNSLQDILPWPFQIVKRKVGISYTVQTVEARVANGVDAAAIASLIKTKQEHVRQCFSAINPTKHTDAEMRDLYAKSELDDELFDDLDRAISKVRKKLEASPDVKRLGKWAGSE